MGKDSEYYKDKTRNQKLKLRELISLLPPFAVDYIYSKELNAQPSTLISYSYDLLTFFRYLISHNSILKEKQTKDLRLNDLKNLTDEDIKEYLRYLELSDDDEAHENQKKAIARKMSPLRGMFLYLVKHGSIDKNPMDLVDMPKIKKDKNIIRMNQTEIDNILTIVENGSEQMSERQRKYLLRTKDRDSAILTLMLGTGIRVSECVGLDVNDLNFTENSMKIVRKGGGQDILYFSDEIAEVLNNYIEGERNIHKPEESEENALFFSLQGKRISVDAVEKLVKKFAKIAVPDKKITPHKLRSTYGTALYRSTGDIRLVADVLGHENVNTTVNYYAAIEDEHKRIAAGAVKLRKNE